MPDVLCYAYHDIHRPERINFPTIGQGKANKWYTKQDDERLPSLILKL